MLTSSCRGEWCGIGRGRREERLGGGPGRNIKTRFQPRIFPRDGRVVVPYSVVEWNVYMTKVMRWPVVWMRLGSVRPPLFGSVGIVSISRPRLKMEARRPQPRQRSGLIGPHELVTRPRRIWRQTSVGGANGDEEKRQTNYGRVASEGRSEGLEG